MPIGFSRIRLAGFKSFAEPATVEVRPGLTGIVGPNGCGKSNVVEALRWAMGESSAKSLRGGEMDDVIFAGTAHRPARTLAEVTLTLESTPAAAFPPPFDGQSELEVSRRIERGSGSTFRVNAKEARARDVQTLFADLASGARASAMVSQGRVSAIVAANPGERRAILEEAAGIGGLHSRRHEAELKLRAAEANAERAEDLRQQLSTQLANLQKQARQSIRYRSLSGLIRAAEAELLAIQQARTTAARTAAQTALAAERARVTEATAHARTEAARAEAAALALPELRAADSTARTALERSRIAGERIDAEHAAARAALAAATEALTRLTRDRQHAADLQRDADQAEQRLAAEAAKLAEEAAGHPALADTATQALTAAEAALQVADAGMHQATTNCAALAARGQALADATAQARTRAERSAAAWQAVTAERARIVPIDPADLTAASAALETALEAAANATRALDRADAARTTTAAAHQAARARLNQTEPLRAKLAAEQQALAEILGVHRSTGARLIDTLTVPVGLEAAIAAALGEALDLATDPDAPLHWASLAAFDPSPPLPAGVTPLATLIVTPPPLARALSQIGLVSPDAGDALHQALGPGQILVSRDGAVWRWDGLVQRAGTATPATVRLQQRNRLIELRARLAEATAAHDAARANAIAEAEAERAAIAAETAARATRRTADHTIDRARATVAELQRRADATAARIAALSPEIARLQTERDAAQAELASAEAAHAALPNLAEARDKLDRARAALAAARSTEHAARARLDTMQRQASARHGRQRGILSDRAGWADRARDAATRLAELDTRQTEAEAAAADLATRPAQLEASRAEAATALDAATNAERVTATRLRAAEAALEAANRAERAADTALAAAREAALRAEAACQQADHAWGTIAERIIEKLGADPDLPPPPDLTPEAEQRAARRSERLTRERDEMGPVNLCAEREATEIETRLATIDHDRAELTEAIHKLRGSIGHLNREGRERLAQVFAEVDRHFQTLFARMFGGGRAHLALVGSDDPLTAGLEIYAQPPGKKLATLSLLSGGEQALTALSLIFAVFRCNPAPVCVLDEVDAPLDDANIDRFCALLTDMVTETGTRFLVVTHHHMTMARMDRLYGVTMAERGVSRLLSVDLQRATELVEAVAMAAE